MDLVDGFGVSGGGNYGDAHKFLDECAKVAAMLGELHRRFNFERRKQLLRAVFRRIEVRDKEIVGVELNPPFSFFFDDTLRRLFKRPHVSGTKRDEIEQTFKNPLIKGTKWDVFEQIVGSGSAISDDYAADSGCEFVPRAASNGRGAHLFNAPR